MRGPLLSGAVGSPVTVRRLAAVLAAHPPIVVIRSPWLGLSLAAELPLVAVLPRETFSAARRRRRRKGAAFANAVFVLGGAALPLAPGTAGSLVVPDLSEVEPAGLIAFLLELAPLLRPGGRLVGLDRTKDAATEARLAGALLGSGYLGIAQERPREGALLTLGHPPPLAVRTALAGGARLGESG